MVEKWCWFSPINIFHENFPSRFHVFCLACQFDIVHIHWWEQSSCSVDKETFPINKITFPNRVPIELSQIAFSHNSPARGWPCRLLSRITTGSSRLDHDFGYLCFGRRNQNIWTVWLWNFEQFVSIFHFDLSISGYCCLSWTSWKPWNSVNDFCGCHLRCWWSLFKEHCIRTRIICDNVTPEYDSASVFLILKFQLRILKMTDPSMTQNEPFCP